MPERRTPPDIAALLRILLANDVAFVLAGSVAVQARGLDVGTLGDLDIVPELTRTNLSRLAAALRQVNAVSWPVTGRWIEVPGGEFRWQEYPEDHPLFGSRIGDPDPDDPSTFDSLFSTDHGELDIVPMISGRYDELVLHADRLTVHGVPDIAVMSPGDLLARLAGSRRAKDAARVEALRALQRELSSGHQGDGRSQDGEISPYPE